MHKDFIGCSLENINAGTVETKYIVESIRDEKTWKKFCKTEDIDLYEKREYDNIAEALTFYLTWFISDQCYDIKLWEYVYVNGEMLLEQIIEPQGCIGYNMRMQIDRDMNNRLHLAVVRAKELEEGLQKENNLLKNFIKLIGRKEQFEEFIKVKAEEK